MQPLHLARQVGFLLLPDQRRRAHDSTIAEWRESCRSRRRRFVMVQPVGSRRSRLRVEVPESGTAIPNVTCRWIREDWIADGRPGLAAIAEPNRVSVRLPHDTAAGLAAELANAEVTT
jgi:hypothetical protein